MNFKLNYTVKLYLSKSVLQINDWQTKHANRPLGSRVWWLKAWVSSPLSHWLAVWPWASYLPSLCLSVLTYKIGIMICFIRVVIRRK